MTRPRLPSADGDDAGRNRLQGALQDAALCRHLAPAGVGGRGEVEEPRREGEQLSCVLAPWRVGRGVQREVPEDT